SGSVFMTSEQGRIYQTTTNANFTRELLNRPLESSDRDRPGPLPITSIDATNGRIFIGTLSRGVLEITNGAAREVQMKPPAFFVNALERDREGHLWIGARAKKEEPGTFSGDELSNLKRQEPPTGPVMTLTLIGDEMWAGTDGR